MENVQRRDYIQSSIQNDIKSFVRDDISNWIDSDSFDNVEVMFSIRCVQSVRFIAEQSLESPYFHGSSI